MVVSTTRQQDGHAVAGVSRENVLNKASANDDHCKKVLLLLYVGGGLPILTVTPHSHI